ncbi:TetR/AcrR family transcriptional regulator [Streptomyces sp. NPDC046261]|uniref:TetR/AcrR family transcriptional regulator n=1 Tax=Streptomyces sp. NPDC046261 TaxID=3157200 RepID=UPI0033E3B1EC
MDTDAQEEAGARVLDAAEELFYARGLQAVGMDAIRGASGVSLKRLYRLYPSKDALVEAYLRRRDERWRAALARHAGARPAGRERLLAVYDWLGLWFAEPGFRGCAFVNSFGELGTTVPAVAEAARAHKEAFRGYVAELVAEAGLPGESTAPLVLLAEGAIARAAVAGDTGAAHEAREAARALLDSVARPAPGDGKR